MDTPCLSIGRGVYLANQMTYYLILFGATHLVLQVEELGVWLAKARFFKDISLASGNRPTLLVVLPLAIVTTQEEQGSRPSSKRLKGVFNYQS